MPWQYRPQWTIPGAGDSETVLHFHSDQLSFGAAAEVVRTFFQDIVTRLPNEVSIQFPGVMTLLNTVTGALEAEATFTPPVTVVGTGAGGWAGGVGAVVQWETGLISAGRRQRGRTFLVPLTSTTFATDGTLDEGFRLLIQDAANDMLQALEPDPDQIVVWSRTQGIETRVNQAVVPDRSAILRDRRDG